MPGEHINFLLDFPAEMMGWGVSPFNPLLKSKDMPKPHDIPQFQGKAWTMYLPAPVHRRKQH